MSEIPAHVKPVLKRVVADGGDELLRFYAEKEDEMLSLAKRQADVTDGLDAGDVPDVDVEARAEQLIDGLMALMEGSFPAFYAEQYIDTHADDNAKLPPEKARRYADLSADEWEEQKSDWADGWRNEGLEGTDDELARAHVTTRFGVSLEAFAQYVVTWGTGTQADRMEEFFGGTSFGSERYTFVGLGTAEGIISNATDVLEYGSD